MDSVEALVFCGWVPRRVDEQEPVGCRQVEPHPSGLEGQEQDPGGVGGRVLELRDHRRTLPLRHRSVQPGFK